MEENLDDKLKNIVKLGREHTLPQGMPNNYKANDFVKAKDKCSRILKSLNKK